MECHDVTHCTKCDIGYFKTDTACTACIKGCAVCLDAITCTTYMNAYFKDGGVCTACSDGCALCTPVSVCATGMDGYFMSRNAVAAGAASLLPSRKRLRVF